MKHIPIFFTFDNNYVEPAAVAFHSLMNKAEENVFYEMYVLHSDITEARQHILTSIIKKSQKANLTFIHTNGALDDLWKNKNFNYKYSNSTFTVDTIVRCFGARFFPQYDKIIYSDVDVIFTDDISELYDIDLSDKYLAGVKNAFTKYSNYELSHLKPEHLKILEDKYISGGIWVMNLKKIREDALEEKMIDIIQDKSIIKRWNDQDIMNIACDGKVGFIPLNYISYPYLFDLLSNPDFTSDYSREELYDSIINPKIIHFAANKPWNGNPQYSNLWWTHFHYLELSKSDRYKPVSSKDRIKLTRYKKTTKGLLLLLLLLLLFIIIRELYIII